MYQQLVMYFLFLFLLVAALYFIYIKSLPLVERPSKGRMLFMISFLAYLSALIALTVVPSERFSLNQTIDLTNYIPLINTYKRYVMVYYFENYHGIKNFWQNLIGNIILFIPLGWSLTVLFKKSFRMAVTIAALTSASIEITQYLFSLFGYYRYIDVDDVLLNVFGAGIGFIIGRLMFSERLTARMLAEKK